MKKAFTASRIFSLFFIFSLVSIGFRALNNADGPPAERTGAPSEANCTACHSGSVITNGTNWNKITLTTNIPAGGYVPGVTYSITLSLAQAGITRYGFETTVRNASGNMAGSFIAGTGTFIQSSGGRSYINHIISGTSFPTGTASWTFSWKAPTGANASNVIFYVALNAANGDNTYFGDQIYTKSFSFSRDVTVTGLFDDDNIKDFRIYPNPVIDELNIEFKQNSNEPVLIHVYDLNSKQISSFKQIIDADKQLTIPLNDLNTGIYLLEINNGQTQKFMKFFKQ